MLRRVLAIAVLATALLPTGVQQTVHARNTHTAATQPTDTWVEVDPPDGQYTRVFLFVHSVSLVGCRALEVDPKTGYGVGSNHFGVTYAMSGKDGTIVLEAPFPTSSAVGLHAVKATCDYPIEGSGTEPQASFITTYSIPAKKVKATPPADLQVWVDPSTPTYRESMSLYAKTVPGALCSAYFVEGSTWDPGDVQRVGNSGIAVWGWIYQSDGTAYVTCDDHKLYMRGQADYGGFNT